MNTVTFLRTPILRTSTKSCFWVIKKENWCSMFNPWLLAVKYLSSVKCQYTFHILVIYFRLKKQAKHHTAPVFSSVEFEKVSYIVLLSFLLTLDKLSLGPRLPHFGFSCHLLLVTARCLQHIFTEWNEVV